MSQDVVMTNAGRTYGGLSPQQRSNDRRERLLNAARALIADSGVAPITVDMVCQQAKLSKRYFYTEFATKDDLLDACAEDLFGRLWAGIEKVLTTTRAVTASTAPYAPSCTPWHPTPPTPAYTWNVQGSPDCVTVNSRRSASSASR